MTPEHTTPIQAAAETIPWPNAATRQAIAASAIRSAVDAAQDEMTNVLSKSWQGATVGDMVQEIRRIMLNGSDQ